MLAGSNGHLICPSSYASESTASRHIPTLTLLSDQVDTDVHYERRLAPEAVERSWPKPIVTSRIYVIVMNEARNDVERLYPRIS
jgi:hypothetical protein